MHRNLCMCTADPCSAVSPGQLAATGPPQQAASAAPASTAAAATSLLAVELQQASSAGKHEDSLLVVAHCLLCSLCFQDWQLWPLIL
jgi:hypothetical protein